ncbi:uncharacterized protein ARMOST_06324 [Armillaria ostoyae]|uniref:Uncharacterized protein n=1 Tax=Armillaria ostoyae TaxID=47428 RepID=A0A284R2N9_ARMOS|nr:uncharacterized protein ARMOST_06324 [Armillaria ostoyae]
MTKAIMPPGPAVDLCTCSRHAVSKHGLLALRLSWAGQTGSLDYWRPVVILLEYSDRRLKKLPTGANIPQQMARLNLAESSLVQTLVAFMERAVSLTFVKRIPLARVLEYVQTSAYNFLPIFYHLLDDALWLLRSAANSIQLVPEGVPFRALHVSILDRFKSFRYRCKLLRNSLPDIGAVFSSGQAVLTAEAGKMCWPRLCLATELKAVGFHYISRMLPGGLSTHAALIDDLPAVFSVLKRSAHNIVDGIDTFEQHIFRFRDCFADMSWVEMMVGNAVLVKGMLDVLLSISHEQSKVRSSLSDISLAPVGIIPENIVSFLLVLWRGHVFRNV